MGPNQSNHHQYQQQQQQYYHYPHHQNANLNTNRAPLPLHYNTNDTTTRSPINATIIAKDNDKEFVLSKRVPMEPTVIHRGLQNESGENNCFLNVTIQALWHLGQFRVELKKKLSMLPFSEDKTMASSLSTEKDSSSSIMASSENSILSAVHNLFVQYEFAEMSTLPPTELRIMLHRLTDRFDLGSIADSNEALDAILSRLHVECSPRCPGPPKCLAHQVFGGCIMEQVQCRVCGATSEPELKDDYMHLIYVSELLDTARGDVANSLSFGKILRSCMCLKNNRCPGQARPSTASQTPQQQVCTANNASLKAYVLEASLALALPLVWAQSRESADVIVEVLSLVSYSIKANDLFYVFGTNNDEKGSPDASGESTGPSYVFRGMVCYYGKHYVSIFQEYSPGEPRFLLFDDSRIRSLGTWTDVKAECGRSLYQPVLLLYELESSAESASVIDRTRHDDHSATIPSVTADVRSEAKVAPVSSIAPEHVVVAEVKDTLSLNALELTAMESTGVFSPYRSRTVSQEVLSQYETIDRESRRLHSSHSRRRLDVESKAEAKGYDQSDSDVRIDTKPIDNPPYQSKSVYELELPQRHNTEVKAAADVKSDVSNGITPAVGTTPTIVECHLRGEALDVVLGTLPRGVFAPAKPDLLGIETSIDSDGRVLVVGLYRHPLTHAKLPAEESGKISLLDQLLAINGQSLVGKNQQQVGNLLSTTPHPVRLTIRSASSMCLVCKCPYCESDIVVSPSKWTAFKLGSRATATLACDVCYAACTLSRELCPK